jgi:membrane-bound ClpP family serine protease
VELQGKSYKLEEAQAGKYKISPRYFLTPEERNTQPRDFLGAGRFGYYTAAEAVATGLARREYSSPEQVASALGLPGSVVQGNPLLSLDQPPRAGWIEVSGEIDRGAAETVKRKIDTALSRHKVDCLIFHINAFGGPGSVEPADSLARYIEDQAREKNVLTVAFISGAARGAATFVAFGCRQIVMGPNADLGDCEMLVRERGRPFPEEDVKPARDRLIKLAEDHGYPPVLARGLMDPSLEIVQVQEIPDPNQPAEAGGTLFMTRADAEERKDRFTIVPGQPVKRAGSLLKFNTDQAVAWGIARHRVESAEKESVIALYGVEPSNLVPLRADWLDSLVNVLTHPVATVFLVIVGFTCLILEFKAPGVGFPAITAALCFILLFWAHSWLAREVNSLAILLFLLGLVLLGVEIFLLPGFGIAGISGIVLILLSLALVVVQRWPQSEAEYAELGKNVGLFAGGLCVAAAAAYILARQLPSIPVANRLVLPPPEETSDAGATLSPATAPALLGAIGIAVTTLRPTGKARFGDEFVDVVAEGHYLEAGARVQVIEIDGLRVVVKPV